jgi:glycine cleavage system regulatory protein
VPAEAHGGLIKDLEALSTQGIRVQLAASGSEPGGRFTSIRLELVGNDRPGIVRDITRVLAEQGVNLENLLTEVAPAPMSGELLFTAEALLAVPETLPLEQLQARLETLADDRIDIPGIGGSACG